MGTFSFDIVSDYNLSEVINAVDQTKRELMSRYDLKGTSARLDFTDNTKSGLTVVGDSDYHIDTIIDMLGKKLSARGVSLKIIDASSARTTSNMKVTQLIHFKKGLSQENAKKITSLLREHVPKVKPQIQGDTVRVAGQKKDELQAAIRVLEAQEIDVPLQFVNFR